MFVDRVDAGRRLARELAALRNEDVVVLGLPRGGVPVAFEVAAALDVPLDVIVVRKLGVPFQPEVAMGAIGENGIRVLDSDLLRRAQITDAELATVEHRERVVLNERIARLRRGRTPVDLQGRVVVIVDDGMATGSTARAACLVARGLGAAKVIMAVPVAPLETVQHMPEADAVVCVSIPDSFVAVGAHYQDFSPTGEEDVVALLDAADRRTLHRHDAAAVGDCLDIDVTIPADAKLLEAHLHLPDNPKGVVIFAHGSGSSRHSPRNRFVAQVLQQAGLGTLLLDLLTPEEERDRANVFDIELLASRLNAATDWLAHRADTRTCRFGYFGASTGAAAALWAAAEPGNKIDAIVSRGGRPDLAAERVPAVNAPTLLIVGGADDVVLDLNRRAQTWMHCPNRLTVVPGATHLFEEPGTLTEAATLASEWFRQPLLADTAIAPPSASGDSSAAPRLGVRS